MKRTIHLHIDRLTLDGVAEDSRETIAAAIEREVARRLTAPGATDGMAAATIDRIDGGRIASPNIGTAIGARIAAALTGGGVS